MLHKFTLFNNSLDEISLSKTFISTLPVHWFNTAHKESEFRKSINRSYLLLPDGIGVEGTTNSYKTISLKENLIKRLSLRYKSFVHVCSKISTIASKHYYNCYSKNRVFLLHQILKIKHLEQKNMLKNRYLWNRKIKD